MRTAEQIRDEWLTQLLPSGAAWTKDTDSNLAKILLALAAPKSTLESDIAGLRNEISPLNSTLLLADYKALLGDDPYGRDEADLTDADLRALLYARWTARGGQSIAYYTELAAAYGVDIQIFEPQPPVYGTFAWGDGTVFGTPDNDLWVWQVTLPQPGTGLEAVFLANRQPDVEVIFRYASGSGFGSYAFNQLPFGS
ncbi:hypothetical protein Gbfr_009_050 [Gluconobacter frateurii M-2]|nr:hypothetical protein Gbfr_009_050 [Gluconobacter frateurii M-2]